MRRLLIAGIGNIFLGDDGFGVAVARALATRPLPQGTTVRDFGVRGLDLAYALLDGCDAAILVDAVARGASPGTLYVLEPDGLPEAPPDLPSGHDLVPARVFDFVRAMGGTLPMLRVVGCEPASFGSEAEPALSLSPKVLSAVEPAAALALEVAEQLCRAPGANRAEGR